MNFSKFLVLLNRCPLCKYVPCKQTPLIPSLKTKYLVVFPFSLPARVWLWTLRWWGKLTVWSQTCWPTPRCPQIPAAPWRLSKTCWAPRSACSLCTGPVSPPTRTPAPTPRRDLKERSGSPFRRCLLPIIHSPKCSLLLWFWFSESLN